jgi:hypothetical protein
VRRTARSILLVVLPVALSATLFLPAPAEAGQRTRVVVGVGYGPVYYPGYYRPWGPYGWYPYGGPYGWGPYPYGAWAYDPAASLRIQSTPREAQVYVDGYFVGVVDDFDGWSQRLRLAPGEYQIQLYLPGYRTVTERMLLRPGTTYNIRRNLERLAPGEPEEPRPEPGAASPSGPRQPGPPEAYPQGPPPPYPPDRDRSAPRVRPDRDFGTLAIRVRPADAEVSIDGERWDRPGGEDRLTVDLAAGTHTIEVRKEGYTTYTAQIDVPGGRVTTVNVSLPER